VLDYSNADQSMLDRYIACYSTRKAWRFALASLLFLLGGVSLLIVAFNPDLIGLSFDSFAAEGDGILPFLRDIAILFLPYVPPIALLAIAAHFLESWRHCQEPTLAEALAKDPRDPILYLRPFKADKLSFKTLQSKSNRSIAASIGGLMYFVLRIFGLGKAKRGEELVVDVLDGFGPVVAIGRPGERIPPVGAARVYVGDEWRDVVRDYMARSQLILMFAGTTPNFAWEIGEVFRTAPFVPTVMLLPFFRRHRQKEVDQFVELFSEASGLAIPNDLRKVRALYFSSPTDLLIIKDEGTESEKQFNRFNPFLSPLVRIFERDRPAWGEEYLSHIKAQSKEAALHSRNVVLGISAVKGAFTLINVLMHM
jgi:hypothetical protein